MKVVIGYKINKESKHDVDKEERLELSDSQAVCMFCLRETKPNNNDPAVDLRVCQDHTQNRMKPIQLLSDEKQC